MSGMWPQPQVGENFLDDLALVNEGDDAHRAPTPLTQQRIGLMDLLDQVRPALLEERRARWWGNLDRACGRSLLGWLLCLDCLERNPGRDGID